MDLNASISSKRTTEFSASMSSRRAAEIMAAKKKNEDERDFSFAIKMARIFAILATILVFFGTGLSVVGFNAEYYALQRVHNSTELEPDVYYLHVYYILRQVGPMVFGCGAFCAILALIVALDYRQYHDKINGTNTRPLLSLKLAFKSIKERVLHMNAPKLNSPRLSIPSLSSRRSSRRPSNFSFSSTMSNGAQFHHRASFATDHNLLRPDWAYPNSVGMRKHSLTPTPTQPVNRPTLLKRHSTGLRLLRPPIDDKHLTAKTWNLEEEF